MRIAWVRILIAGILSEVMLIVVLTTVRQAYGQQFDSAVVFTGGFALPFIATLVVCRRPLSRFILHGVLVGVAAILLYTALTFRLMINGQLSMGVSFFAAHLVKVLGGAAGGFVAGMREPKAGAETTPVATATRSER